jgi:hypothetical protein
VLTEHFVDEPGHPTREALDRVLAFFKELRGGDVGHLYFQLPNARSIMHAHGQWSSDH